MLIIFKCLPDAKRALDEVMRRGEYADYSDVINTAVTSFALLTTELETKGSIVLPSGSDADQTPASPPRVGVIPPLRVDFVPRPSPKAGVPQFFAHDGLPDQPPAALAPAPSDAFVHGAAVPLDRWIFGQYSKVLPAKASCRAMARLLQTEHGGFQIEKVAGQIAQEAAELGAYLQAHDERHGLIRDDALSTGFPAAGENGDKSRLRYANQFVAAISKQGQLSGLQLTKAGWTFAAMSNPILDGAQVDAADRLSNEERTFLIEHIARCVPAEDFAFRTILAAIKTGLVTPEMLDAAVKKLPVTKKDGVSDSFVTTQRSGLMSRMADLALVTRARDGVRVSYVITESGSSYAARAVAAA
jgi:hypothetical protein